METHILLIDCTDEKGLISKISTTIFHHGLNILIMKEYVEEETNHFFMRMELSGELQIERLEGALKNMLPNDAIISINPKRKKDIVLLVTKEYHCLSDLLIRHNFEEINATIKAVIGNHEFLRTLVEKFGLPYHFITHENKTKEQFEDELYSQVAYYQPDYLVLAKFMRILSPDFVGKFENKIINIHHSFLPAFVGANPYKQAYERGVKLIGATAHIVNNHLDEGPIITQQVIQVDHSQTIKKLVLAGHEVEKNVLAEACKMVFEDRVFVSRNKTIVFS